MDVHKAILTWFVTNSDRLFVAVRFPFVFACVCNVCVTAVVSCLEEPHKSRATLQNRCGKLSMSTGLVL